MDYNWYILRVVAGREQKIAKLIEEKIISNNLSEYLKEISVPSYTVVRITRGKKIAKNKSVFSGYVMINANINDKILSLIDSVPGALGFIGENGVPSPLSKQDIEKFNSGTKQNAEQLVQEVRYEIGQKVKIISGPFASFAGTVDSINDEKQRLKVMVSIFGRPTPVDLDWSQIEISED